MEDENSMVLTWICIENISFDGLCLLEVYCSKGLLKA